MNLEIYTQHVVDDIYAIGEFDVMTFSAILGLVTYGQFGETLGKSLDQRIEDSCQLISFLINDGDFVLCRYVEVSAGELGFKSINCNLLALQQEILKVFADSAEGNRALLLDFGLSKVKKGNLAPKVGVELISLFAPCNKFH